jgi:hypothetical protein
LPKPPPGRKAKTIGKRESKVQTRKPRLAIDRNADLTGARSRSSAQSEFQRSARDFHVHESTPILGSHPPEAKQARKN